MNRATFYQHFEDKADLLDRGLDLVLVEAVQAVEAADRPADPFELRVSRRIAAFFDLVRARSGFNRGLVSGPGRLFLEYAMRGLSPYSTLPLE